jgi:hypothetical protein
MCAFGEYDYFVQLEKRDPDSPDLQRRVIKAKYPGFCKASGKKIKPGDNITYCVFIQGWILADDEKGD